VHAASPLQADVENINGPTTGKLTLAHLLGNMHLSESFGLSPGSQLAALMPIYAAGAKDSTNMLTPETTNPERIRSTR
jgi:hypothetical protein